MSEKEIKIVNYIIICVNEFAFQKKINRRDSYNYLKKYKGIEFLNECYEAEHTLSLNDAVEDLTNICKRNGGNIE